MRVVVITQMDYAGSGYQAVKAMQLVGIDARHIAFLKHPWGFEDDLVLMNNTKNLIPNVAEEARELIRKADFIHIWNTDIDFAWYAMFNIPKEKIKTATYTGSLYRMCHAKMNEKLKKNNIKITVQNPSYRYNNEIESVFIPHALDTMKLDSFNCYGGDLHNRNWGEVAVYSRGTGKMKTTTREEDIEIFENELNKYTGGKIIQRDIVPWEQRMEKLSKAWACFEYMDENMQWFGRSTIEASFFGVPCMTYFSMEAFEKTQGRMDYPIVIKVTRDTLHDALHRLMNLDENIYKRLSRECRLWAASNFNLGQIGNYWREFFEGI